MALRTGQAEPNSTRAHPSESAGQPDRPLMTSLSTLPLMPSPRLAARDWICSRALLGSQEVVARITTCQGWVRGARVEQERTVRLRCRRRAAAREHGACLAWGRW